MQTYARPVARTSLAWRSLLINFPFSIGRDRHGINQLVVRDRKEYSARKARVCGESILLVIFLGAKCDKVGTARRNAVNSRSYFDEPFGGRTLCSQYFILGGNLSCYPAKKW